MSRDWILGLAAALIWIPTYVWYFMGTERLRSRFAKLFAPITSRLGRRSRPDR